MVGGVFWWVWITAPFSEAEPVSLLPRGGRRSAKTSMVGDMIVRAVELKPITEADIGEVAEFLHLRMNSGTSVATWHRAMNPPWDVEQANHGYLLRERRVVGAYLASYSERMIDGRLRRICNLGAWCVAEQHRATGLRMLRSLLRQRGYTFTDLTPNPNVVALNTRLGFAALDTETALVPNIPWPVRSRGVRVVDTPNEIDGVLSGQTRRYTATMPRPPSTMSCSPRVTGPAM